jgi:uncharacterized phage protein gp47/JayE
MSDVLDDTGLTLQKLSDIVSGLETGMKAIYGDDINIDSDSPDGQMINLFAQTCIDLREVLQDVYSSFDPDQAEGVVLDQRCAINGVKRNGGTFTVTPINITVDRSVTLAGLDTNSETLDIPSGVYTVKDDAGTQFVLLDTVTLAVGTSSLPFRAAEIGAVLVTTGTIKTAVTAIAGVTAINNTSGVSTQGVNEESDAALRVRRQKSVAGSSIAYLDSIEAAVLALDGVTSCNADENNTGSVDANGTPAHTVWVIAEGGKDADIANALYAKKSAGAGWRGAEVVSVTRPNGRTITVKFDRPTDENLYIKFGISLIGGGSIDTDNLKTLIVENVTYAIGESASTDAIVCYLKDLNAKYRITGAYVSKNGSDWYEVVDPTTIQCKFILDTSRISIS